MLSIFIYLFLYLIVVLFFWSLSAINRDSAEKCARRLKSVALRKDVSDCSHAKVRCQAYTIQSLYSQYFIAPDEPQINYTFRNPLPSFKGTCEISVFCEDFTLQTSFTNQIDAIRHGHNSSSHGTSVCK